MSRVIRIFVEKKPGFDIEAGHIMADLRENLGMTAIEDLRYLNRYDISGLSQEEFQQARGTILSEPNVDQVYDEEFPAPEGYRVFAMEYLPGQLYNFHPGSHVGQGMETGIAYIADALNAILTPEQSTTVLLETMSGKGSEVGRTFEELKAIIDKVGLNSQLGVCLDTCHVWDAGYDIADHLDDVISEFDRIIGLDRLKAIHLNDSLNPLGAHKDRHARLGEGHIGLPALKRFINHPALAHLPFYLETPNDLDGYAKEIQLMREAWNY